MALTGVPTHAISRRDASRKVKDGEFKKAYESADKKIKILEEENKNLSEQINELVKQLEVADVEQVGKKISEFRTYFDMEKSELYQKANVYDESLKASSRVDNMIQVLFENELI